MTAQSAAPLTVRIAFTVLVDPAAWALEYGVEGAAAIREDVRRYVEYAVRAHLDDLGLGGVVAP